ncbi:hypothetical protein DSO57_1002864 [Entomophthora muscae]|uniref:Uncharacterized protein n=1 Tax=Entomophthora muscae TaxID=34485 RepID=A0ACC2TVL8_9FUNG|nr:hypothetical protein DSO57_1002864 [Entomophthora muscae]
MEAINQNKGLTTKQRKRLHTFIKQYQDLFRNEDDPLPPVNLEKHVVNTENHFPVRQAPYCLAKKYKDYVEDEINRLLSKRIIELSMSP